MCIRDRYQRRVHGILMKEKLSKLYQCIDEVDFHGQKLVNQIYTWAFPIIAIVCFVIGYVLQNFRIAVWIYIACGILILILLVPGWPFLNRHPVKWLSDDSEKREDPKSK
eukprot:TRINITY_DN10598_c0_g1_i5.p2 TRINITY_DN10598_c0_g1~~TRINITY_DN10598_c0_g1_i5.p2  ORF type:complete len:110 (+),score=16.60 TRINITY_DN10598_c0_g1_i5:173-502(+)